MTKSLLRLTAVLAGVSAPLCVWAVSAQQPTVEAAVNQAQAMPLGFDASQATSPIEDTIVVLDLAGEERRIPAAWLSEEASSEAATCCWVYFMGTWWCIPCY